MLTQMLTVEWNFDGQVTWIYPAYHSMLEQHETAFHA